MIGALRISRRNGTYQVLHALKNNRAKRNELREIFVEGVAPIKSALRAGRTLTRLIFQDYDRLSDWAKKVIASSADARLIELDRALFEELSERSDPSEILATFGRETTVLGRVRLPECPFVVIVDRPGNHGNLGSLIRSANAFGVDLVVTTGHGVDLYDPAVIRASMGSIFLTNVCHEQSTAALRDWIQGLKESRAGLSVVGTDSTAETSLSDDESIAAPAILLFGNEAKGLSVRLKELVDKMARIPMNGEVDSLNLACAASIVLYEIYKRRRGGERGAAPPAT